MHHTPRPHSAGGKREVLNKCLTSDEQEENQSETRGKNISMKNFLYLFCHPRRMPMPRRVLPAMRRQAPIGN